MTNIIEKIESEMPDELVATTQETAARVMLLGGVGAARCGGFSLGEALGKARSEHDLLGCALHRADLNAAAWLEQTKIDVVSLAAMQAGRLDEVRAALGEAKTLGAGETEALANAPLICFVNGIRLGFLAYSERRVGDFDGRADLLGLAVYDHVRMLLSQCDHVIVLVHAGLEGGELPLPEWRARYRRLIDAGASAVVDTGATKGWEAYKQGLIFYGLGDPTNGAALALSLTLLQNGELRYEAFALGCADEEIGFSSDEAQKQCINEQNELFLDPAAYLGAVNRMCLRYYEEHDPLRRHGILEAILSAKGEAARREEETRLIDVLADESRRYTLLRAFALKQGAKQQGGHI